MNKTDWRTRPVAGIGIVGLDHVAVTDRWEHDTKSTATHYFEQVGGPVPVALMAMARLGLSDTPLLVSNVGRDTAGDELLNLLQECDVDSEFVRSRVGHRTPHSLVILNVTDGTRSLTSFPGSLAEESILASRTPFAETGLLHSDGRETRWTLRVKERSEALLSLDLGSPRPTHRELLPVVDIIIASKFGGAGTFPMCTDAPLEQTKRFLDLGATVAGVTLGAGGVVIGSRDENGGEPVYLPAFKVENVVDTCGAGDLFHGAFLWAYREGKTVIDSATFAQAAVALRIQHYGNVAGQPTREQVEAFLATR